MNHRTVFRSGRAFIRLCQNRLTRRFRRDASGAVAVEFGFVALPFFTLVFAIMQIALVFMADQILESAVADAARMIRTGQAKQQNWQLANFNTQVCNELYMLFTCSGLQTYITTAGSFGAISTTPPVDPKTGLFTTSPSYNSTANSASQIVVVSVFYEYPSMFAGLGLSLADQANSTRLLGAVAAFRNEPFPY